MMDKTRVWKKNTGKDSCQILKKCLMLFERPELLEIGGNLSIVSRINMLRFLCSQHYNGKKLCLRNILINYFINAQIQCKGSEIWLPKFILSNVSLLKTFRVSTSEAINETKKLMYNSQAKEILELIPSILGSSGRITSEIVKSNQNILEVKSGYSIKLLLNSDFSQQIGTDRIFLNSAKVLIIEGAPQSVAEINKFLELAHEDNQPVILVARSFPEEVIATLSVNWLKKTLCVIPLQYGNLLENINSHADISAISGATPISPMMGDTLQVDFTERYGKINNITITSDTIFCTGTTSPEFLIKDLYERLRVLNSEAHWSSTDKVQLYVDRISGLSDDLLSIRLMERPDVVLVKEEVDIAISYYNYLCYLAAEVLIDNEKYIMPYLVYDTALEFAKSYNECMNSIGGFLIIHDE